MRKSPPIALLYRPLHVWGRSLAGPGWEGAVEGFTAGLRAAGAEGGEEDGTCRVVRFPDPAQAEGAWKQALARARGPGWTGGPLPIQGVLHRGELPEGGAEREAFHRIWDHLLPERLHATAASLGGRAEGVGPLGVAPLQGHPAPEGVRLLPAVPGDGPECFYCGLRSHGPAECPSKTVGYEAHGLSLAGNVPLGALRTRHPEVFSRLGEIARAFSAEVDVGTLRREPVYQLFAAFFDAMRIYQLRFLVAMCFSSYETWPGVGPFSGVRVETGSTLGFGLDCLRVGNHRQAEEYLRSAASLGNTNWFYAEVAFGFIELERGRPEPALGHLQRAARLARERAEVVYVQLLVSRCRELRGDREGAEAAAGAALEAERGCPEAEYRLLQLAAESEPPPDFAERLRDLVAQRREYFVLALLDPKLEPVRPAVDTLLASLLERAAGGAGTGFAVIRSECEALASWLGGDDAGLKAVLDGVADLERKVATEAYFPLLDSAVSAERLLFSCRQLKERRLGALLRGIESARDAWHARARFWDHYPYKGLFRSFGRDLLASGRDLEKARALTRAGEVASYRDARDLLTGVEGRLKTLRQAEGDLTWARRALDFLRSFGKKLLVTEALALPVAILGAPLLGALAGGATGGGLPAPHRLEGLAAGTLLFLAAPGAALFSALRRRS